MYKYTQFVREGVHVEVDYDRYADNPFNWGWEGLAIISDDWRKIDSGDVSLRDEMARWEEDRDNILTEAEDAASEWEDAERAYLDTRLDPTATEEDEEEARRVAVDAQEVLSNALSDLADHDDNRPDLLVFVWNREYAVYCDPDAYMAYTGVKRENLREAVEADVKTYHTWAEGGVFCITVYDLDEDGQPDNMLDSLCGVMFSDDCPTDDEIWNFVRSEMNVRVGS